MARQQKKKKRFYAKPVMRVDTTPQPPQHVERSGRVVKVGSLYPDVLARRPHLEYVLLGRKQSLTYTPENTLYVMPFHLVGM